MAEAYRLYQMLGYGWGWWDGVETCLLLAAWFVFGLSLGGKLQVLPIVCLFVWLVVCFFACLFGWLVVCLFVCLLFLKWLQGFAGCGYIAFLGDVQM